MKNFVLLCSLLLLCTATSLAQPAWQTNLDSKIRFYQPTDFGIVLAGTEKSLYAVDGRTGSVVWRGETGKTNETAATPIPNTDLLLLSRDLGSNSRLEAVDLLSGERLWKSERVKGDVMQLAVDPTNDLVAVVMVKDPRGKFGDELKRRPIVHVLKLSDGDELWKREMDSSIEMMPGRFREGDVDFTLDNYRAPLLLDGRLFLFYEGATSYDALTGKEKEREKFKVNEDGLALTEADPVFDESHVFVSGRGRIRAVNRRTGEIDWKADDVGNCAEMALIGSTLFIRTGGQFTRLNDGEIVSKGQYGVSAIDTKTGETLWRYKGADKGLTNFTFRDANTILIADSDDIITIDAGSGKRLSKNEHKIENAQFVIVNESRNAIVGGRNEMAAFDERGRQVWHAKHTAPGRGVLRIIGAVALRAAALYFRYGGVATSAFNFARGGLDIYRAVNSFRWSGLNTRFGSVSLSTLAANAAKNYAANRIYSFGSLARMPGALNQIKGLQVQRPSTYILGRIKPSGAEVRDSILDRLDPARQAKKLSSFLLRRKRVAELRGDHMYFFTELAKPFDRKGLVGVNVHNGRDQRFVLNSDPDPEFFVDEAEGLLYSSDGSKLQAFDIIGR